MSKSEQVFCKKCGDGVWGDGNEEEELCKHCLDHVCERCYCDLETEEEYDRYTCEECWEETPKKKSEPQYFTFTDIEIFNYEMEQIERNKLKKKEQPKKAMSV